MKKSISLFILFSLTGLLFGQNISIMSYNIRYDNAGDGDDRWDMRKTELLELMKSQKASIIGIQEGLYHQVQYIDSCLSNFSYSGVGREDGKTKGEFSAIFYDQNLFSAEKETTFWLSETPDEVSVGWDASMERICSYVKLKHKESGTIIHVFNTHFDHIGEEARIQSAMLIIDKIMELCYEDERIILLGDFNAVPESEPIMKLTGFFKEWNPVNYMIEGPEGTFSGFNQDADAGKRIDYIFTANVELLKYQHLNIHRKNGRRISDHLPVKVIISL